MSDKLGLVLVGLSAIGVLAGLSSCWKIGFDMTDILGISLVGMSSAAFVVGADAYTRR